MVLFWYLFYSLLLNRVALVITPNIEPTKSAVFSTLDTFFFLVGILETKFDSSLNHLANLTLILSIFKLSCSCCDHDFYECHTEP